ncbi:hypothetical protein JMJ77_0002931 [Colletotrichum scovillei]|uniref:Uncharacterized protein n=1 Tax=Colletotrichum scovillei TaxID=1209932 RepID=A0A9P7U7I7_9PEZI|nr:hypothetical protein JMJ78_0006141 [Colletotrichum scovillei]KAG7043225.1 hypothetical protein JMJ77_0002931 [Colletotrichum scovillei]KAG7062672.1 hypothetical protein JMJ76_0009515 [Colletotrichum scovillei]
MGLRGSSRRRSPSPVRPAVGSHRVWPPTSDSDWVALLASIINDQPHQLSLIVLVLVLILTSE